MDSSISAICEGLFNFNINHKVFAYGFSLPLISFSLGFCVSMIWRAFFDIGNIK